MRGVDARREHRRIAWIEPEHGWAATPEDIVAVRSNEGFEACKREQTTSRRNRRPAGGLWQGVNPRRGSVASAIWDLRVLGSEMVRIGRESGHVSRVGHPDPAVRARSVWPSR